MLEAFHKQEISKQEVFSPYYCATQTFTGIGSGAKAHYHEYIEFLYCLEGKGLYLCGDERGEFFPGDLILINSQKAHATYSLDEKKTVYICVRFDPQYLCTPSMSIFELKYLLPFTLNNNKYQSIFRADELKDTPVPKFIARMLRESENKEYGYEFAIHSSIYDMFLWILRYWQKQNVDFTTHVRISNEDAQLMTQAILHIETHYADNITLSDVAKNCNMSYSAFSKLFNKYMQKSFSEYLAELRIFKASQRLATSNDSITEIACAVGYSTTSYFIQQFKEFNGITPKQYRENFKME